MRILNILLIFSLAIFTGACQSMDDPSEISKASNNATSGTWVSTPSTGTNSGWTPVDDANSFNDSQSGDLSLREFNLAGRSLAANEDRSLFESVYFDFDQSAIRPDERYKLENVADHLKSNPSHNLRIEGHCDWRGTVEFNQALGDRRCNSAKQYLGTLGISENRISVLSFGSLNATTQGNNEQMQKDRRTDFVAIKN